MQHSEKKVRQGTSRMRALRKVNIRTPRFLLLRQICKYEVPLFSSSGPTPSPSPIPEGYLESSAILPSHIKHAIIQRIRPQKPEDVISTYVRTIYPWFPIISVPRLRSRLPPTWDEAPIEFTLLCLSVFLLSTIPPSSLDDDESPSEFKSLYLCTKSWISLIEGLGVNSSEIVQAKTLVTLFEVAHGFYPAAYVSIGATIRAADALEIHPGEDTSSPNSSCDEAKQEEDASIWCGILILDRYITIESGPHPSLSRSRTLPLHKSPKPHLCPTHAENQDRTTPIYRMSRLFEASSLLDRVHTVLHNPTAEHAFNMEEVMLVVGTLNTLQTILIGETEGGKQVYSGGLGICNTGILLALENGMKVLPIDSESSNCNSLAVTYMNTHLSTVFNTIEPFVLGVQTIDFDLLPPFITYLVYNAAAIVTQRLWMETDSEEGLRRLKILREFLKMVGTRWLGCERYLKLLNEDTTPRILKAIEQV
ncbi:hypothetical protein EG329_000450 [Mollisiaceae sp. DMI_Dod_QoI]|nr:hypothetical protein EG329_000450 [Helotiales sp. DMI_Dod_QoI]